MFTGVIAALVISRLTPWKFLCIIVFHQANKEIPALMHHILYGDTMPAADVVRSNIHRHGRTILADELCKNVTGEVLNFNYFLIMQNKIR